MWGGEAPGETPEVPWIPWLRCLCVCLSVQELKGGKAYSKVSGAVKG